MQFTTLALSLLQAQFWSITPALPAGTAGTRLPVGTADIIPDVTFVARELVAADGMTPADQLSMNTYIRQARAYHALYGLNPTTIHSFDDILRHFAAITTRIGRIRILSHGWDQRLFLAVFTGGKWDFGMHPDYITALATSDEAGLRWLFGQSPTASPVLQDGTSVIITGMNTLHAAVMAPFAGGPHPELTKYFQLVNDLYQVQNGTITAGTALITAAQQTTINTSLGIIETAIKSRLVGTTIGATTITDAHLTTFKTTVLSETPVRLGFFGPRVNLAATVIADVQAALTAAPRVEADLRTALTGRMAGSVLGWDYLDGMIQALASLQAAALILGGTAHTPALINANADLRAFALVALDLHHLRHGDITINNVPITAAERTTLRNGLVAIGDLIRARVAPPITAVQLNTLRTAIENRSVRESGVTGGVVRIPVIPVSLLAELTAANTAMAGGFRTRYTHFRGLMQPANASKVDIRGCHVGAVPTYLTTLRDFMGGPTDKPAVSAPDWWQSFPFSSEPRFATPIFPTIDGLASAGLAPIHVSAADVGTSLTEWKGLIDFDTHFAFITGLFAAAASVRDFASLHWRAFPPTAGAIPVLRMEASRIDDLPTLNLGEVIERFRGIFEIPAATPPNAAARTRLTALQPHVATFRNIEAAIAAVPAPTAPQLNQFLTDLTNVKNSIIAVPGFPAPATPLTPPAAPPSLADIQAFVTAIGGHLNTILTANLGAFFTAVRGAAGHANAELRYYLNIGLPLLVRSSSHPTLFAIVTYMSGPGGVVAIEKALKSWMRIQWSGTTAQANTMNAAITAVPITTNAQRAAAAQVMMVSEREPAANPTSPAEIHPTAAFRGHIITRP